MRARVLASSRLWALWFVLWFALWFIMRARVLASSKLGALWFALCSMVCPVIYTVVPLL